MAEEQQSQDWPELHEAHKQAGTSLRSLQRAIARGEVRTEKRPVPGRKPVVFCNREDIERVRKAMMPSEAVRLPNPKKKVARQTDVMVASLETKIFLSLTEARAYSGLSESLLKKLAKTGQIGAFRSGRWYFPRVALERLGEVMSMAVTDKMPIVLLESDTNRRDIIGANGVAA